MYSGKLKYKQLCSSLLWKRSLYRAGHSIKSPGCPAVGHLQPQCSSCWSRGWFCVCVLHSYCHCCKCFTELLLYLIINSECTHIIIISSLWFEIFWNNKKNVCLQKKIFYKNMCKLQCKFLSSDLQSYIDSSFIN